jgi:hypothetical protein
MDEKRVKVPLVVVIIVIIVLLIVVFCVSGPHSSPIWRPKTLKGNRMEEFRFLTNMWNKGKNNEE